MTKTAQQMFRELHYEIVEDSVDQLVYKEQAPELANIIQFNHIFKGVTALYQGSIVPRMVGNRELKAVIKQCRELGYLK